jgi:cell division septum initiation protein DivIVA
MATADVGIFDAPPEDELPNFARVVLGYDPREVDEYLRVVARERASFDNELHRARAEAQEALHRLSVAREEVYAEIAGRMADVIKASDLHAERVRDDAEDAARKRLAEADREATQIRSDATAEAGALRIEAGEVLDRAKANAAEVIGALDAERESALRELERLGERLASLAGRLQDIRRGVPPPASTDRQKASFNESSAPSLEPELLDVDLLGLEPGGSDAGESD